MNPSKRNRYTHGTKYEAIRRVKAGVKITDVQMASGTISKWISDSSNVIVIVQGGGKSRKQSPHHIQRRLG